MKKVLFILVNLVCAISFANDSTWKLCQGKAVILNKSETILVNLYEHRNLQGDGRETQLTLILGGYLLSGAFDSTESDLGNVNLVQLDSSFTGSAKIDYTNNTLELDGLLNIKNATDLKSILKCRNLNK